MVATKKKAKKKAKRLTPKQAGRQTAEHIEKALVERRWTVQIVERKQVKAELVDVVKHKGLMKCVDGRASDFKKHYMHGPKTLGGIYAIASMRGVRDAEGLAAIVDEVRAKGYLPSVHGDTQSGCMGCGYFKLWKQGLLPGVEAPHFGCSDGKLEVTKAGGKYEELQGKHFETQVVINLVKGKTLVPNAHNQRFVVDGWVLGEFKLDLDRYLELAASTVEQLSWTCRSARIIVP